MESVQVLLAIELFVFVRRTAASATYGEATHTGETFCVPHGFVNIGEAAPSH
jgi:hypothetical protein